MLERKFWLTLTLESILLSSSNFNVFITNYINQKKALTWQTWNFYCSTTVTRVTTISQNVKHWYLRRSYSLSVKVLSVVLSVLIPSVPAFVTFYAFCSDVLIFQVCPANKPISKISINSKPTWARAKMWL